MLQALIHVHEGGSIWVLSNFRIYVHLANIYTVTLIIKIFNVSELLGKYLLHWAPDAPTTLSTLLKPWFLSNSWCQNQKHYLGKKSFFISFPTFPTRSRPRWQCTKLFCCNDSSTFITPQTVVCQTLPQSQASFWQWFGCWGNPVTLSGHWGLFMYPRILVCVHRCGREGMQRPHCFLSSLFPKPLLHTLWCPLTHSFSMTHRLLWKQSTFSPPSHFLCLQL